MGLCTEKDKVSRTHGSFADCQAVQKLSLQGFQLLSGQSIHVKQMEYIHTAAPYQNH